MKLTPKQRAARRKGGRSRSAAKVAAVRANGAKGGRPRKDGQPRVITPSPVPAGILPLWQRIEAFLRVHGPTTLRSLRCVAIDRAERERVRQELQRRPQLFHVKPAERVGGDVWEIAG